MTLGSAGASTHQFINSVYERTRWTSGAHKNALARLSGAAKIKQLRFDDGVRSRAVQGPYGYVMMLAEAD